MKTLQRILMFFLVVSICILQAQGKTKGKILDPGPKMPSIILSAGYGNTIPSSTTKDAYFINSSGITGDLFVPFLLFRKGWDGTVKGGKYGFNIGGTYNFGGNGNPNIPLPLAFPITGQTASSIAYKGIDPRNPGFRIGGGPQVNFSLGDHFIISPMVLAEYFSTTQKTLSAVQTTQVNGQTKEYNLLTLPETKTTGFSVTPKMRMSYFFGDNFGIYADAGYIFGPKANTQTTSLKPEGNPNQARQYNQQQLDQGTQVKSEVKSNSYQAFAVNVGLSFAFGKNRCPNGDCRDTKKVDDKGWNGLAEDSKMTKEDSGRQTENLSNGSDIFTATHIKKENSQKPNCVQIMSPSNGSNQNINEPIKVLLSSENLTKTGNVDIKIYKISNDKNYFNKKENFSQLTNTQNSALMSTKFDIEAKDTGFQPISIVGKQTGAVVESSIEKGQLSEGTYKMVVNSSCGVTSSNFMVTSSALKTISLKTVCKEKFGDYSYTFVVQNTGTNPINITSIPAFSSSTGTISSFTFTPLLPIVLAGGAIQNFTGSFTYSGSYTGDVYASVSGYQVGNVNLTSQDTEMGELKSCICDFCTNTNQNEFDSDHTPNATYSATGNSLSIHQTWWTMNSATATTIVAAKAEIISFSREVSEDCMKCDKNSDQWGNFISGTFGAANGSFGNTTGSVTGNTHHTLYFANPNSYVFDLNISLPPISTLSCCREKFKIKIRYTYTFKDPKTGQCKMCSEVFEYSYQKGQCPIKNPDGGGIGAGNFSTKGSNIKN